MREHEKQRQKTLRKKATYRAKNLYKHYLCYEYNREDFEHPPLFNARWETYDIICEGIDRSGETYTWTYKDGGWAFE